MRSDMFQARFNRIWWASTWGILAAGAAVQGLVERPATFQDELIGFCVLMILVGQTFRTTSPEPIIAGVLAILGTYVAFSANFSSQLVSSGWWWLVLSLLIVVCGIIGFFVAIFFTYVLNGRNQSGTGNQRT